MESAAIPLPRSMIRAPLARFAKTSDVQRGILAGGGAMHADCEAALLEDGSHQEDVWGADWNPATQQVTFESLINIRPRQNNPALEILDPGLRQQIARIVQELLGGL
jgi:hypothetical protein